MAKIKMTYPKFGWFDDANVLSKNEFHPNSADPVHGGVSVIIDFQNLTGKTIKYISFVFVAYNAVGDPVVDIGKVTGTGPYTNNQKEEWIIYHNAWYNHTIKSVKLGQTDQYGGVVIEYMDGTYEKLTKDDIQLVSSLYTSSTNTSTTSSSGGGCYVATAVYGSYDCPEVWTLRRFRDNCLAETWYGRAFIRTYYAISPTLVKWFGNNESFRNFWKKPLDKMVSNLLDEGYSDKPYDDKTGK